MAVSRKYKTKGGELREETLFMDVTTWSGTAEYCSDNLGKGAPIIAEGRLVSNEWEDKTTGQRRSKIEMTADRVQQLAWPDSTTSEDGGQAVKHTPVPDDEIPF
jgi:single-strand DNA-binding protein